ERAELPPLALRAHEVPGRALPVDVGHLGLLGHAAKRAPKGTVRPSSLQILIGLVDLGFRRGAVLIVSALTTTTAIGRRCGRLRQRVAKPVARRPCRLSPRLLYLAGAEALRLGTLPRRLPRCDDLRVWLLRCHPSLPRRGRDRAGSRVPLLSCRRSVRGTPRANPRAARSAECRTWFDSAASPPCRSGAPAARRWVGS